ncbi:MAG: dCTP deaminase [Candidatus Kerfeldbacteria bacterium]|nr:dCTP deaminase [Candidatus Kerfeldbacteria bacterium]
MILSDRDIKKAIDSGRIVVDPLFPNAIQPASIDLHLGKVFLVFDTGKFTEIDIKKPIGTLMRRIEIAEDEPFIIHPGEFALGITIERTGFGSDIAGRLEGKSSLGRIGLLIHATAGYIDPGNSLHPTLELHNVSPLPIKLYFKMPIAQMSYIPMSSPVERPYGSQKSNKYYGSSEPQASRIDEYFKNNHR